MTIRLQHELQRRISTRLIALLDSRWGFAPPVLFAILLMTSAADLFADDRLPTEEKPLPVAAVDALNALSGGPHAGFRANHAKGLLTSGSFTPAKGAAELSAAPHFAASVPVLVRFSNPTGVPNLQDADPNASPHGMAIRFQLPDGSSTDIVSISANGFP